MCFHSSISVFLQVQLVVMMDMYSSAGSPSVSRDFSVDYHFIGVVYKFFAGGGGIQCSFNMGSVAFPSGATRYSRGSVFGASSSGASYFNIHGSVFTGATTAFLREAVARGNFMVWSIRPTS